MNLRFVGKNGSMGLTHGKVYSVQIKTIGKHIYVHWRSDFCPYDSLKKLNENWKDPEDDIYDSENSQGVSLNG